MEEAREQGGNAGMVGSKGEPRVFHKLPGSAAVVALQRRAFSMRILVFYTHPVGLAAHCLSGETERWISAAV